MIVLAHVTIALFSLAYSTYLCIVPSRAKFYVSYGSVALTIASGTYLVVKTHAPMLQSCVTGLFYLGATSIAIVAAHSRLASQQDTSL